MLDSIQLSQHLTLYEIRDTISKYAVQYLGNSLRDARGTEINATAARKIAVIKSILIPNHRDRAK